MRHRAMSLARGINFAASSPSPWSGIIVYYSSAAPPIRYWAIIHYIKAESDIKYYSASGCENLRRDIYVHIPGKKPGCETSYRAYSKCLLICRFSKLASRPNALLTRGNNTFVIAKNFRAQRVASSWNGLSFGMQKRRSEIERSKRALDLDSRFAYYSEKSWAM